MWFNISRLFLFLQKLRTKGLIAAPQKDSNSSSPLLSPGIWRTGINSALPSLRQAFPTPENKCSCNASYTGSLTPASWSPPLPALLALSYPGWPLRSFGSARRPNSLLPLLLFRPENTLPTSAQPPSGNFLHKASEMFFSVSMTSLRTMSGNLLAQLSLNLYSKLNNLLRSLN